MNILVYLLFSAYIFVKSSSNISCRLCPVLLVKTNTFEFILKSIININLKMVIPPRLNLLIRLRFQKNITHFNV